MTNAYVIEIGGEDVGLIVRQTGERAYRFHAATPALHQLDGYRFATPQAAERAAALHMGARRLRAA